MFRFCRK